MSEQHYPSLLEEGTPPSQEGPNGKTGPSPRRWPWVLLAILVALGLGYYFLKPATSNGRTASATSSSGGSKSRGGAGPIPVVATRAQKGNIGVYLDSLGAVTPIYTVTVKSRVDGELMQIHYKEGDLVHQGELLAEIDSRPFEAQLKQFEGLQTRDQALLDNARVDLGRYTTLLAQNAIPEQQLVTQRALVTQYEGAVKNDQGQIDAAKLNVTYCHVTAPISGRAGLRLVDPGNIVHASDSIGLLVITQIHPISVIFTIAEDYLPSILKKMHSGQRLTVEAFDRKGPTIKLAAKLSTGTLTTLDNQIDQSTGSLRFRATFDNRDNALFPNQFVNTRLLLEEKQGVTLILNAAIERNSQATYVYLVKPDSSVAVRPVTLGTIEGDQAEIVSGLAPGDAVVISGIDKLQEGSKVNAQFNDTPGRKGS